MIEIAICMTYLFTQSVSLCPCLQFFPINKLKKMYLTKHWHQLLLEPEHAATLVISLHCRARICKRLRSPPRDRFQGIDSASLYSLAGRYDKQGYCTGPPGYICWRNLFLVSINVYIFWLWSNLFRSYVAKICSDICSVCK